MYQDTNSSSPYGDISVNEMVKNNIPINEDIRRSFLADNDAYAADLNKMISKKSSVHAQPLFASIILFVGIPVIVALTLTGKIEISIGGLIGICAGIYALYLMVGLICNPLFSYLSNIEHGVNF